MPILRPERIGSMWTTIDLRMVHGPRFTHPNKLQDNTYLIRGISDSIVKTKTALLKSNGQRVVQSRLRKIRDWEKPLIEKLDVQTWRIKPVRELGRDLFAVYSFYFRFQEAVNASNMLKGKGYKTRIYEGRRKGIRYWIVLRNEKALYYPKLYTDQRMSI